MQIRLIYALQKLVKYFNGVKNLIIDTKNIFLGDLFEKHFIIFCFSYNNLC